MSSSKKPKFLEDIAYDLLTSTSSNGALINKEIFLQFWHGLNADEKDDWIKSKAAEKNQITQTPTSPSGNHGNSR